MDLDPHILVTWIRIRSKLKYGSGSALICRWEAKMYGIRVYFSTLSGVWVFIWKLRCGSGSASGRKVGSAPNKKQNICIKMMRIHNTVTKYKCIECRAVWRAAEGRHRWPTSSVRSSGTGGRKCWTSSTARSSRRRISPLLALFTWNPARCLSTLSRFVKIFLAS